MENEMRQPLDDIMTKHGLSNADLVNASTEQLTFKMVNKGRKGRRLSSNIQDKILTALLKVKPQLKLRRRDLFRYEIGETVVEQIQNAAALARSGEASYPEYVDLLAAAGITRYLVELGAHRITYFGVLGEAHIEEAPVVTQSLPGYFNVDAIRAAIGDTQKKVIDYPTFLKRIYAAGVAAYEVNIRQRKIDYRGEEQSYRETIPVPGTPAPAPKVPAKNAAKKPAKKKKSHRKSMTTKARVSMNKRYFTKKRKGR